MLAFTCIYQQDIINTATERDSANTFIQFSTSRCKKNIIKLLSTNLQTVIFSQCYFSLICSIYFEVTSFSYFILRKWGNDLLY